MRQHHLWHVVNRQLVTSRYPVLDFGCLHLSPMAHAGFVRSHLKKQRHSNKSFYKACSFFSAQGNVEVVCSSGLCHVWVASPVYYQKNHQDSALATPIAAPPLPQPPRQQHQPQPVHPAAQTQQRKAHCSILRAQHYHSQTRKTTSKSKAQRRPASPASAPQHNQQRKKTNLLTIMNTTTIIITMTTMMQPVHQNLERMNVNLSGFHCRGERWGFLSCFASSSNARFFVWFVPHLTASQPNAFCFSVFQGLWWRGALEESDLHAQLGQNGNQPAFLRRPKKTRHAATLQHSGMLRVVHFRLERGKIRVYTCQLLRFFPLAFRQWRLLKLGVQPLELEENIFALQCSATCGQGSQRRTVQCTETCDEHARPSDTQLCNIATCVSWVTGHWSEVGPSLQIMLFLRMTDVQLSHPGRPAPVNFAAHFQLFRFNTWISLKREPPPANFATPELTTLIKTFRHSACLAFTSQTRKSMTNSANHCRLPKFQQESYFFSVLSVVEVGASSDTYSVWTSRRSIQPRVVIRRENRSRGASATHISVHKRNTAQSQVSDHSNVLLRETSNLSFNSTTQLAGANLIFDRGVLFGSGSKTFEITRSDISHQKRIFFCERHTKGSNL